MRAGVRRSARVTEPDQRLPAEVGDQERHLARAQRVLQALTEDVGGSHRRAVLDRGDQLPEVQACRARQRIPTLLSGPRASSVGPHALSLWRVRRCLIILLVLAWAAPAEASPRALAYTGRVYEFALAGDHALAATSEGGVLSVPTAGGPASQLLPGVRGATIHELAASSQRVAAIRRTGQDEQERSQLFVGPPMTAQTAPLSTEGPDRSRFMRRSTATECSPSSARRPT